MNSISKHHYDQDDQGENRNKEVKMFILKKNLLKINFLRLLI